MNSIGYLTKFNLWQYAIIRKFLVLEFNLKASINQYNLIMLWFCFYNKKGEGGM